MNSIVESLALRATQTPDKICLIDSSGKFSFAELYHKTLTFANFLQQQNIKQGDCIVMLAEKNATYFSRALGVHLVGGSVVPLETNCPTERILEIIHTTKSPLYVADRQLDVNAKWVSNKSIFKEALSSPVHFPESEWIADILFTTGTTGKSKGVMISHRAVMATAENLIQLMNLQEDDVVMVPTPFNHAHALRRTYISLLNGHTTVLTDGIANLQNFFQHLNNDKVTGLTMMPAMIAFLLKMSGDMLSKYKNQIRFIESGSAPLNDNERTRLFQLLPNSKFFFSYGSTESGSTCGYDMSNNQFKPFSIGFPTTNSQIEFADENGNIFVANKEHPGYIVSTGKMNMTGYYNEPELTKTVLHNEKIYSSDIGYKDDFGEIYFLGRTGDIINMGGIKISALEIEQIALQWEEISECACVAKTDADWGQVPILYVVLKKEQIFHKKNMLNFMKEYLELSRIPKEIIVINELPKTANGKVKKEELLS